MLTPELFEPTERIPMARCRACSAIVKKGENVLHLKLGTDMPFDRRNLFLHTTCTEKALVSAKATVSHEFKALQARMATAGDFFVE